LNYILHLYSIFSIYINQPKIPEGPELRIIAAQLNAKVSGLVLTNINILSGPYKTSTSDKYKKFRASLRKFSKATLNNVETTGKVMYWELTPKSNTNVVVNEYLVIGFGLTGGFKFEKGDHSRIEFVFNNSKSLYYNDIRNFGTFEFMNRVSLNTKINAMGPDAFEITDEELADQLATPSIQKHEIAKALLNQKVVAGIGNYLRAEILYVANVDPMIRVKDLNEGQIKRIHKAIHSVMDDVMECKGTLNYMDTDEKPGSYKFKVYQQEVSPDGRDVKKTTLACRSIYHV